MYREKRVPSKEEITSALKMRHTKEVQDKLSKARVAICGLGGLGSAVAVALARTGIGALHLIDFDYVDLSNINRQQYALRQLGMPKTQALFEELRRFSPYMEIETSNERITEDNCASLIGNADYICEAFDAAEQKAMLTNYVLTYMPDKYLVGASGMAGYHSGNSIKTRRVTSHYYLCGDGESEIAEGYGLMAPRVMICAAHQANTIVELIVRHSAGAVEE